MRRRGCLSRLLALAVLTICFFVLARQAIHQAETPPAPTHLGSMETNTPQIAEPTATPPAAAYTLATIQQHGYVSPTALLVGEFRAGLIRLSHSCHVSRAIAANLVMTTYRALGTARGTRTYLDVLHAMTALLARTLPDNPRCTENIAAWITLAKLHVTH